MKNPAKLFSFQKETILTNELVPISCCFAVRIDEPFFSIVLLSLWSSKSENDSQQLIIAAQHSGLNTM
jgi:hypothetical protein